MDISRLFARAGLAVFAALALASCNGDSDSNAGITFDGSTDNSASGATITQAERTDAFAASLDGGQEVPPNSSTAKGSGTVVVDPDTLLMTATVTTIGLPGTVAHIHQAPPNESGPIIFPLTETTPGSGIWTTSATLTQDQYNLLIDGGFYFNVHSSASPEGEIRGQILAQQFDTADSTTNNGATVPGSGITDNSGTTIVVSSGATGFFAALRGEHEVPPTSSVAQGSAAVLVDTTSRQLIAAVTTSGVAGTSVNLYEAAAGLNGPPIASLTETAPSSGVWATAFTLNEQQYIALRSGNLYVSVQSAAFPEGEIRGQLLPQRQFTTLIPATSDGSSTTAPPTTGISTPGFIVPVTPASNIGTPSAFDTPATPTGTTGVTGSTTPSASGFDVTGNTTGITGTTGTTGTPNAITDTNTGTTTGFNTTPITGITGSTGITGIGPTSPGITGSTGGTSGSSTGSATGMTGTGVGTTGVGTTNTGIGSTGTGTGIGTTTTNIGSGTGSTGITGTTGTSSSGSNLGGTSF